MAEPQVIAYDGFAGGLNLLGAARDIADNELVDATNFELAQGSVMRTRPGVTKLVGSLPGPVTSIFHYRAKGGTECVLFTAGTKLYRMAPGATVATDITGALTLTAGAKWQWVVLNDQAIGFSGQTTGDNPIVVATPGAAAATALTGSPPKGVYAEVMDGRIFTVDAASPNTLRACALGLPTDWSSTGKAGAFSGNIGGDEGDNITGIKAHRGVLVIWKRSRIYVLNPGSPATDTQQWSVQQLTDRIGCISGYTVQPVLDDLLFLSDHGVVSLGSAETLGDFKNALVSAKVPNLQSFLKTVTPVSVVNPQRLQYWVATAESTGTVPNTVWNLDYRNLPGGGAPVWTRFKGGVVGTAYGTVLESGVPVVYVGGANAIYRYGDDGVYTDDGVVYEKTLLTKAFSPSGPQLWRKEFLKYALEFQVDTDNVLLQVSTRIDERDDLLKTTNVQFGNVFSGAMWDVDKWDTGKWATVGGLSLDYRNRFAGTAGRRGQVVQFRVYNNTAAGFRVRRLTLDATLLTRDRAGDVKL